MNNRAFSLLSTPVLALTLAVDVAIAGETEKLPKANCATGCSVAEPAKSELGATEISACLEKIAVQPLGKASLELETLLFHAPKVIPYLSNNGQGPLKSDQARFLKTELARTHARVQLRVVDADGKQRMTFDRQVPIGEKQHLHPKAADGFTPPEISFTIQRVGLNHLWSRL